MEHCRRTLDDNDMPFLYEACLNNRYDVDAPAAAEFQVSRLADGASRQRTCAQLIRAVESARQNISRQLFDEMTPEFHGNQLSIELNLTRGSRRGWIDCLLIATRGEAGPLVTVGFAQVPEYSVNKRTATRLDGDEHERPKRRPGSLTGKHRYGPAHQEHDGSL
jgi:hypothetical protein